MGTAREQGLRWANPFYTKKTLSLRVRNFESEHLKVNDKRRQPDRDRRGRGLEGGGHRRGVFEVDNYENFVHVQSEAALRNLATATRTTRTTRR